MYIMRDEASWFLCLLHFMAFVIYASGLGLWDGGLCIPNLFCFRIAFEYNEHSLSSNISSTTALPFSLSFSDCPTASNPKIQQLHTVLRAVYLLHRCRPLPNSLTLVLQTHTVHFILRQETADISITITLAGRSIRQTVYCPRKLQLLRLQMLPMYIFAARDCCNHLRPLSACVYVYVNIQFLVYLHAPFIFLLH